MQKAHVVFGALHSLGKRNLPLTRPYRLLYNPHLFPTAARRGDELRGVMDDLRHERFRWGASGRSDRWVSQVLTDVLHAYVGADAGRYSHGIRPGSGLHTALRAARTILQNADWRLGLEVRTADPAAHLCRFLLDRTEDQRLVRLVSRYFEAQACPSHWPADVISDAQQPGDLHGVAHHLACRTLDRHLSDLHRAFPQAVRFVRYMNHLLVTATGTRDRCAGWMEEARTVAATGFSHVSDTMPAEGWSEGSGLDWLGYRIHRPSPRQVRLGVSERKLARATRMFQRRGKPAGRGERTRLRDQEIRNLYGQEFAALDQFYALAQDRHRLRPLQWTMRSSLYRTLAQKHHSQVRAVVRKEASTPSADALRRRIGPTQYQVSWISDVLLRDPKRLRAGEPCAMKVARTVRREAFDFTSR